LTLRPRLSGAALQGGNLLRLRLGLGVRLPQLVLGLALALLAQALRPQILVAEQIAGGLLDASCDLVLYAHAEVIPRPV